VEQLQKNLKSQAPFRWLLFPLSLGVLILTIVSISQLIQQIKIVSARSPIHKVVAAKNALLKTEVMLNTHFVPYQALIQSESTQKTLGPNGNIYSTVFQEEQDMVILLESYRASIFNVSSNISGSGEWHRYYRQELGIHINRTRARVKQLATFQ